MAEVQVASIRMDRRLYKEIKAEATRNHRTFTQEALYLIEQARMARKSGQAEETARGMEALRAAK